MAADLAPLRAIAFDFDGVILESGAIKQQAFLALFADRPELHSQILAHHRRHLGVSRYDKLAWIHRELLGRELSPAELEALGKRYSELVVDRVLACPEVPGARALLEELAGSLRCFVVSATPERELERIVAARELDRYFDAVRGTPGAKAEILRTLMDRYELGPAELLMVGDGLSDYEAARAVGVGFVLRETAEQAELFADIDVERVSDMVELRRWLASRTGAAGLSGAGGAGERKPPSASHVP